MSYHRFLSCSEPTSKASDTVRQTRLRSLCAKNYRGSDDEWVQIVSYVFGQLKESIPTSEMLSGIESSASIIESGDVSKELLITIRKRVQSITVGSRHEQAFPVSI
jgi:hypothetical protein